MVQNDLAARVGQLREEGLPDELILQELQEQGYPPQQISAVLGAASMMQPAFAPAAGRQGFSAGSASGFAKQLPLPGSPGLSGEAGAGGSAGNIYERIEEIAEGLIDEKWDELVAEVRKVIEWKEQVEETQKSLQREVEKLKEDFQVLHQGVLGRLEEYDSRMGEVGSELKAVGKVFKDVVPEFVENVKELRSIVKEGKKGK